ncbi:MAG: endolytic transglycosylase MltG [Burkholderiaceae bacterium]|nr:endolytic transglycosylase MltG [Burkholderiaceae bacterium]
MAQRKARSPHKTRSGSGMMGLLRGLAILFSLALLATGAGLGWFLHHAGQPIAMGPKPVDLLIPYGTSARGIVGLARAAGMEIDERLFLAYARWRGVHKDLRAGVYHIAPGLTRKGFIERLAGHDASQTEYRILEGWTVRQTLESLARQSEIQFDLAQGADEVSLARALGLDASSAEGWLYPDLYVVAKGSSASSLLARAAAIQQRLVAKEWEQRAQGLPYRTMTEALIVASIVEKETQYPGDREQVAAVFANRIRLGMPLQADPTVIYGLGRDFNGDITRAHLKKDTPYNTYTRKTLPPTPISNPGPRAIRAVMNPSDSRALYFVARGDGSSHFSETLAEHNSAVNRFIRRLAGAAGK